MQLYNVTWQFPEIEGQKAAYAKLIDYMASGAEADCFDGFELISRTQLQGHCQAIHMTEQLQRSADQGLTTRF